MDPDRDEAFLISQMDFVVQYYKKQGTDHIDPARSKLLEAAGRLTAALTPPAEVILRHSYEIPPLNMCVRVAVAHGLFRSIADCNGLEGVSAEELAKTSESDKRLIVRIMRILTAGGYAAEAASERYLPTPITTAMTVPSVEASIKHRYDFGLPTLAAGPDYYKRAHFRSPTEYTDTPFQRAFNTDLGFYEYLSQQPDAANNFHTYLSALQKRSPQWVDWFPVEERLIDGFKPDQQGKNVLLIDIGGGRLVLQDIHQPKETEELRMGFESMKYNFFDPQPIRGARIYYFHFVFTDWADSHCQRILRNTAAAMTPGYSKLIINDVILSDTGCHWQHAALDIIMMSTLSGFYRTKGDFERLVDECGLSLEKFWYPPGGMGDGVVEVMKKVEDQFDG